MKGLINFFGGFLIVYPEILHPERSDHETVAEAALFAYCSRYRHPHQHRLSVCLSS